MDPELSFVLHNTKPKHWIKTSKLGNSYIYQIQKWTKTHVSGMRNLSYKWLMDYPIQKSFYGLPNPEVIL